MSRKKIIYQSKVDRYPVKMSFSYITDPVERERIRADYFQTKKDIRTKFEEQKYGTLHHTATLEKTYAPLIASQKQASKEIVEELKKRRAESLIPEPVPKAEHEENFGHLADEYLNRYRMRDTDIDTVYGINFRENGQPVIARTPITIQDDDIIIGGTVFNGTEGLWTLITEKNQEQFHKFTPEDVHNYWEILRKTAVLHQNFDPANPKPRSNKSYKWKHILSNIWKQLRKEDGASSGEEFQEEDGTSSGEEFQDEDGVSSGEEFQE